jgi:hypothetical protein
MANAALRAVLGQRGPSRRYIYDRCNGSSVYQGESRRPCCYMCFVPPPVVVWPDTCEQNSPCECLGRLGCIRADNQKARSGIFTALLLFNFYALALVVFATFAGSDTTDVLSKANFAEGSVFVQTGDAVVPVRAYVGLVNVAVQDPSGIILGTATAEGERVYSWDDFCGNFTGEATSIAAFSDMSSCQTCADTSDNVRRLLILTILVCVPMIATTVLRRFPNYDVRTGLGDPDSPGSPILWLRGAAPHTFSSPTGQLPESMGLAGHRSGPGVYGLGLVFAGSGLLPRALSTRPGTHRCGHRTRELGSGIGLDLPLLRVRVEISRFPRPFTGADADHLLRPR